MANNTTANPWIIDTASSTAITGDDLRIKAIRWTGATTAGHTAIVKDRNARIKWSAVAAGANHEVSDLIENDLFWDGLVVDTLGSGVLYIEIM